MAKQMSYDPNTGKWVSTGGDVETNSDKPTTSSEDNTQSDGNKDSSTSEAEETYNEIDYYNLQGELNYIATEETIKLKAGDTVTLNGLGKYLSGNYYMVSVTRTLDSSGYSHKAEVVRMDFGSRIKTTTVKTKEKPKEVPVAPTTRTYTVVRGDCLWNIAKKFYGNGAEWQKIYNANQDKCGKPYTKGGITYVLIYAGQVLTIP